MRSLRPPAPLAQNMIELDSLRSIRNSGGIIGVQEMLRKCPMLVRTHARSTYRLNRASSTFSSWHSCCSFPLKGSSQMEGKLFPKQAVSLNVEKAQLAWERSSPHSTCESVQKIEIGRPWTRGIPSIRAHEYERLPCSNLETELAHKKRPIG
jgi:hypothetical protein